MANKFQADPEGLMEKGKRIVELYNRYMAEKKKISDTTDDVESAWDGADSGSFITAIKGYDEDFKKLGEIINKIGSIATRHGERLRNSRDNIKAAAAQRL